MAAPTSDPLREFVDKRSDVLSDSTDLDVLLAAILDDESIPGSAKAWPGPNSEARPEPTLVAPPRVAPALERYFGSDSASVTEVDAGNEPFVSFLSEAGQKHTDANDDEARVVAGSASVAANPVPSKSWQALPVPTARQLMLITGFAAALVALGVAYFRAERGDSVVSQSLAATAPTPAPAAPNAEPPATAPAPSPLDVADLTPTREPAATPRIVMAPPARAASDRPNPVPATPLPSVFPLSSTASVDAASGGAATASVAASTAVSQPVVDAVDSGTAPTPIAPQAVDAPAPPSPPAEPAAAAPTVSASSAEPVVTSAALPVPAGVERATPARLLTGGVPEYPAALRTARVGGNVEVRFTIDASGRVTNARSLTGPAQLRAVAEAAVRRWRYEPAHRGSVAVDTETSVNFNFDPWPKRQPQQ